MVSFSSLPSLLASSSFFKSFHISDIRVDWPYNYHANDIYQQVAPVEMYVKEQRRTHLQSTNNLKYVSVWVYTDN